MILALWMVLTLSPLEEEGLRHLYNLDYARASTTFHTLTDRAPSSPAGPHHLATVVWMEELTRRGALAGETFLTARFWTGRKEPVPEELRREFFSFVEESMDRAKQRLEERPGDPEALYFLGANESIVSGFEATLERSYFTAYRAGRRARRWHEQLMALDPENGDAYLVPGVYEYTLATLPRSLKILAFLIGSRGSKEKGYELLEQAARKGRRSHWGARLSLIVVHQREKRLTRALSLLRQMETAFPRNPLFVAEQGWVYLLKKDGRSAQRIFERVLQRHRRGQPNYDRLKEGILLLRLGESFLLAKRPRLAVERLTEALATRTRRETDALIYLRRGQAYDLLGQRPKALNDYETCSRLAPDAPSARLAKRYRERPFH